MRKVLRGPAAITAGLLAALVLTGCGGGGDDDGGKNGPDNASEAGGPGRTPAGDGPGNGAGGDSGGGTGGPEGGTGAGVAALEGAWAGKTGGKAVVLSVASGKAVLITEQRACTGDAAETRGAGTGAGTGPATVTLSLKCADGSADRTRGTVESNDGRTLVVSWAAGGKDTLAKTAPGALPSGLPDLADPPPAP
ncbi:hypothetical protein [Streptomyces sp. PTD5-9]|uniref:hypothetical protein n=1 Tax=Streptomyces sp. PTD5-9 TaxID=3120150 RepID=UPI0030088160